MVHFVQMMIQLYKVKLKIVNNMNQVKKHVKYVIQITL